MAMTTLRRTLLVLVLSALATGSAHAAFIDWWLTPDQQGRVLFERGEYAQAAQRFSDPLWKGLSYYASEDFVSAASWFAQVDTAYGYFYLGNAMAHQDRLEDALAAYDAALTFEPEFAELCGRINDDLKDAPEVNAPSDVETIFASTCSQKSIELSDRVWTKLLQ